MKIAIVLCTLFACTLAAVRPLPVDLSGSPEAVEVRPKMMTYPSSKTDRIVNGDIDKKGDHPYQISLQRLASSWYHTCGASILNQDYILTAAHCVDSGSPSEFRAVAGEYDFSSAEGTEQTIGAAELKVHHSWNEAVINNDVAVVRLSSKIQFGTYAKAISLALTVPVDDQVSVVTGWGYTNYRQQTRPNILQALVTIKQSNAKADSDSSIYDSDAQVASYNRKGGICMGDSGGPLAFNDGSKFVQYGVCSYVMTPCGSRKSDYYASVAYFNDWIIKNLV